MPLDYEADIPEPEFETETSEQAAPSEGGVKGDGDAADSPSDNLDSETETISLPGGPRPKIEGVDYFCEVGNVERDELQRFNSESDIACGAGKVEKASVMSPDSGLLGVLKMHLDITRDGAERDVRLTDDIAHSKPEPYFDRYPPIESNDLLEGALEDVPGAAGQNGTEQSEGDGADDSADVSPGRSDDRGRFRSGAVADQTEQAEVPEKWKGDGWTASDGTLTHSDIEPEVENAFLSEVGGPNIYSEYPVYKMDDMGELALDAEGRYEGRIDTLVEWDDGLDVIDYKTNQMWSQDSESAEKLGDRDSEKTSQYASFVAIQYGKPAEATHVMMGHQGDDPGVREAYESGAAKHGVKVLWADSGDASQVAQQLKDHLQRKRSE